MNMYQIENTVNKSSMTVDSRIKKMCCIYYVFLFSELFYERENKGLFFKAVALRRENSPIVHKIQCLKSGSRSQIITLQYTT